MTVFSDSSIANPHEKINRKGNMFKSKYGCFHPVCIFAVFKMWLAHMYTALPLQSQIKLVHKSQYTRVTETFCSLLR